MVGWHAGGIASLCGVINGHLSEAVADFRAIYHVSLWDVPSHELLALTLELMKDPESRLHAAAAGWSHPISRDWIALVDLVDVQLASKSKNRPKPYPRPWDAKPKQFGRSTVRRSPAELDALLGR